MKKTLKSYMLGFLSASLLLSGVTYAVSNTQTIEVIYDNIKVYKDNVLCETKDANGKVVEPFIYNGTTYMPVRGTANLAGMDVTWDGATKSVYLWDEITAEETYLLDVCMPYDYGRFNFYQATEGNSFEMAGKKYSNGMASTENAHALFNLNSKYSALNCTIGHTGCNQDSKTITFVVDGKTVKTVELPPESLPIDVSVPLNHGLQLKIVTTCPRSHWDAEIGIANMIVK